MTIFSKAQIDGFTAEERQLFDNLAQRAHATIEEEENGGFDVKAHLAQRTAQEAEEETCRVNLEKSFI